MNNQNGGSIVTAIRSDHLYASLDVPALPNIEIIGITIIDTQTPINVLNIYKKPDIYTIQETWSLLFYYAADLTGDTILCGDFNAHDPMWSLNKTSVGEALSGVVSNSRFLSLNEIDTVTIIPREHSNKGSSDKSFANAGLAIVCNWNRLNDTHGSDHFPIKISIENQPRDKITDRNKINLNISSIGKISNYKLKLRSKLLLRY